MCSFTCVSVVVYVARKLRPCPSYSRRRDRINLVLWRSLDKGGGGVHTKKKVHATYTKKKISNLHLTQHAIGLVVRHFEVSPGSQMLLRVPIYSNLISTVKQSTKSYRSSVMRPRWRPIRLSQMKCHLLTVKSKHQRVSCKNSWEICCRPQTEDF